jgi:hypothetical protein
MVANLKSLADGLRMGPKAEGEAVERFAPADDRIASMAAEAGSPETIAKASDDPQVKEALAADLQRNIDQGRNRVPVVDDAGNVTLGFADKELAGLDDQLAAAREIQSCMSPEGT